MERAQQDRRRKLNRKRGFSSEPSSDGFDIDMDDEEDEDEEAMFNDEVSCVTETHHVPYLDVSGYISSSRGS